MKDESGEPDIDIAVELAGVSDDNRTLVMMELRHRLGNYCTVNEIPIHLEFVEPGNKVSSYLGEGATVIFHR
jgi:uncharacterized cupin superfamily protein